MLANDTQPGNLPVTVTVVDGSATGGVAGANADGTITFTPAAGFAGNATFTYRITDGDGQTGDALVTVFVDDLPVAGDLSSVTPKGIAVAVDLLDAASGLGNSPLQGSIVTGPGNGTATIEGTSLTYTPNQGFVGDDVVQFSIIDSDGDGSNATLSVRVSDHPAAADDVGLQTLGGQALSVDVLANDTGLFDAPLTVAVVGDVTGGVATVAADNTILFEPAFDFFGTVSFTYSVTDSDGDSDEATVNLFVDDLPVAGDLSSVTPRGIAVAVDLLGAASGLGNPPFQGSIVASPANGSAAIDGTTLS